MSFSPGKIGEVLKSYLIKKKYDIPISDTIPIVLAERISEFVALLLICLAGLITFSYGLEYSLVILLLLIIIFLGLSNSHSNQILIKLFTKLSPFKRKINDLNRLNISLLLLFRPIIFFKAILISLLAWIIECIAFSFIILKYESIITIIESSFLYSISILFGSISMLPGGIGSTEGALAYLLVSKGIPENSALASTLIIRFATLWLSVIVGFFTLIMYIKKSKLDLNEES